MPPQRNNHRPSRTRAPNLEAAERRVKALEMRKQGCTYRQIAAALGVDLKQAHGYVSDYLKMLAEEAKESAEELRAIEIAKLDKAERECWKRLRAASDADAAKLVGQIKSLSESRRKLTGLDAPVKIEHAGKMYSIAEVSPECSAWDKPPPDEPEDEAEGDAVDGA